MLGNLVTSSAVQAPKKSTQSSSTLARVGQSAGTHSSRSKQMDKRLRVGGSQAQLLQGRVGTQVDWGCK